MIDKHKELYGDVEFDPIPSKFIDERLEVLDSRIDEILEEDYRTRDAETLTKLLKAKKWWLEFKELYCQCHRG